MTAIKTILTTGIGLMILECVAADWGGTLDFSNFDPSGYADAPFFDQDGVFLGPDYVAQLYAWQPGEGFLPICQPVPFIQDGYFRAGAMAIPFTYQGVSVWIQVRAWEAAGGATFEEATLAEAWSGASEVLFVPSLGVESQLCPDKRTTVSLFSSDAQRLPLAPPHIPAKLVGLTYPGPPLVVRQPPAQTVRAQEQTQLSVVASSGVRAFYQWHQDPSDAPEGRIPGATNATYTTRPLLSTTTYWVTIRNSAGTTTSEAATITVLPWLSLSEIQPDAVELTLEGAPEKEYEIQYTTSLGTAGWVSLMNVTTEWWGRAVVRDDGATDSSARFYRAVAAP